MEGCKFFAWMLKHVMRISPFVASITSKLNTWPSPLALVNVRTSVFESTMTFRVHTFRDECKDAIGVILGGVLVGSNGHFVEEITSSINVGAPTMSSLKVCTWISCTIRTLQKKIVNNVQLVLSLLVT